MLQRGTILDGKYRLVDKLGEGGMGTVWVAQNLALEAEVAVKVLHGAHAQDALSVQRFRNEARAAARIDHPSIVRVFDFGEADGAPYLVMERMRGESLAERLDRETSLPPREAAEIVRAVLHALGAAHDKAILHRDLKPENLYLHREGDRVVPKILDFGISKFLGDDAARVQMTRTGALLGTPAYMSPEQVLAVEVLDARSDLWSMGVILFELLTGTRPYDGPSFAAVLVKITTTPAPPVAARAPGIDPALARIVDRALAHHRRDRFASAPEMHDALDAWLRGAPSSPPLRSLRPRFHRTAAASLAHGDTLPGGVSFRPRTPARAWAGLAALALGALGVAVAVRHPAHPDPVAPGTPATDVSLRIEALPTAAEVAIDGVAVALPARIAPGVDHRVRVRAPGYEDWQTLVQRPTTNAVVAYRGERVQPPHPAPLPARDPSPPVAPHRTAPPHPAQAPADPNALLAHEPGF